MSKYRGPRLRIIRRLGELPALTRKSRIRATRPGCHGGSRKKLTRFRFRLIEKQKVRFYYGIPEKQLVRYMKIALVTKGPTGLILLQNLEIRLDNIVYRLGWSKTLPSARQLVSHGQILVYENRTTISSFFCSPRKVIRVRESTNVRERIHNNLKEWNKKPAQNLLLDAEGIKAVVNEIADRYKIPLRLNELLVVEYYSNRI
jgi:small subunit ribosomal protein S4